MPKQITLRMDKQLHADAKQLAVETQRTFRQVVEDALRETITRRAEGEKRKQIALRVSSATGGLQPGVSVDSNGSMFDAMDDPEGFSGD